MKGNFAAVALAVLFGGVSGAHDHRHAHEHLFRNGLTGSDSICMPGCTTIWKTITGEPTLVVQSTETKTQTRTVTASPKTTTQAPFLPSTTTKAPSTIAVVVVPTPVVHSCPTPGTYKFSATTVTISQTTTVCAATSTTVSSGTHTVGGVTTVVVTATTVTCPVAGIYTSGNVTTSTIIHTTYVCPSAGTYTIAPITTTVTEETVIVYPTPAIYQPGTYTAPEQVVTVTKTGYVTVCPLTSSGMPTSTPVPASASGKTQPPAPPKTSGTPKQSLPSTGLVSSNDHLGITYTPYEPSNGQCKGANQVDSDIAAIKQAGFSLVRVYSTDCNTLTNVGSACKKYGVKMIVGVFVKESGCSIDTPDIKEQVNELVAWGNWDLVELLVVGNEAIMNGFCSPQQLKDLVIAVKGQCSGKYSGKITISEIIGVWLRDDVSSALCSVIDIGGANIHAFFEPNVSPSNAGDFVQSQLDILAKICNKDVISLETGWPMGGNNNGLALAGIDAQATAVKAIRSKCGNKTVFFSFENDLWKQPGPLNCEDKWGLAGTFGIKVSA